MLLLAAAHPETRGVEGFLAIRPRIYGGALASPLQTESEPSLGGVTIESVWALAWPTMASMATGTVVRFTDFAMVGSLGPAALAGVGIGGQFTWLLESVAAVASAGLAAILARAVGRGDWGLANQSFRQAMLLGSLLSLLGCALLMPWTTQAIAMFGVESDVVGFGSDYLWWRIWGALPLSATIIFVTGLRAAGDVRTPLWLSVIAAAMNVFLNWVLIYGNLGSPALGVVGAAIASNLSIGLIVAIFFWLWWREHLPIKPANGSWKPDRELFARLIRIGTPSGIEGSVFQVGMLLFQRILSVFGTEAIAAYHIGVTILSFSFIPGVGYSTASATLVGQRLGAGEPELGERDGWRSMRGCIGSMSLIGLLLIAAAREVSGIFTDDLAVLELAVDVIWILALAHPFMAIEFALGGALRGAGDTIFPMIAVFTGLILIRIGLAFGLVTFFDASVQLVWCALIGDYVVKAILLIWRFRRGRWKRVEV